MATPPPVAIRARTPPTPLHGPQYDNYEPYSPRRSKRSTAQRNPYSSFNSERSPKAAQSNTTPPPTTKRARFSRAPPQLSSPPSSPSSPIKRAPLHKTPRKQPANVSRTAANGTLSDSDGPAHLLAPSNVDPTTMLPTPSKTPKKRPATALTARILSFQPGSPGDVMPSARRIKKQGGRHHVGTAGFELYDDDVPVDRSHDIEIYTDPNARVPEMDESEDNPFVGPKKADGKPQRRRNRKNAEEQERQQRMTDAVRRGEGVTYVFRGRTIFRKFEGEDEAEEGSVAQADIGGTAAQRTLKRQAGATAQRPLTRSAIKPRLLFPSEEQQAERDRRAQEADEEAVTDIEMSNVTSPVSGNVEEDVLTPVQDEFRNITPPTTNRTTRRKKGSNDGQSPTPTLPAEDVQGMAATVNTSFSSATSGGGKRGKTRSPFETWQRTKIGTARKRQNEEMQESESSGKRSRSNAVEVDS